MRLPLSKLHRAFPELDGYADEQCIRFVKAARGTRLRKLLSALLILTVLILGICIGAIILFSVVNTLLPSGRTHRIPLGRGLVMLLLLLICTSAGPILAFLLRDFLIIDRIRWILRSRGLCQSCSYSLVGLVVAPDNIVICPECATPCTVDPSLGELTTSAAGASHFRPEDASHLKPPLLQRVPGSVKFVARITSRVALVLLCITLVLALGYEVTVQWKASRARAAHAQIRADLSRLYPPASSGHRIAKNLINDLREHLEATYVRIRTERWSPTDEDSPSYLNFRMLDPARRTAPSTMAYLSPEQIQAMYAVAELTLLHAIDDPETTGYLTALLSSQALLSLNVSAESDDPLVHQPIAQLAYRSYELVPFLEEYAKHAIESGNQRDFQLAIESLFAIDRLMTYATIGSSVFTSVQVRRVIAFALTRVLSCPVPGEWLDDVHMAAERQRFGAEADLDVPALRMAFDELVCHFFMDPDRFRLGKHSWAFNDYAKEYWGSQGARPGLRPGRLGTFRENRAAMEAYCDKIAHALHQPAVLTAHLANGLHTPTSVLLVDAHAYDPSFFLMHVDTSRIKTAGFRIQLAIERYRHDHQHLPGALDQLVPEYLDALPVDHWGDGTFRFITLDPATDPHGRTYLLYSVGSDEQDNGGNPHPDRARESFLLTKPANSGFIGFDYVINDPMR